MLETSLDDAPSLRRQIRDSLGWSLSFLCLPKHLTKTLISPHLGAYFCFLLNEMSSNVKFRRRASNSLCIQQDHRLGCPWRGQRLSQSSFHTEEWRSEDRWRGWQIFSGKSRKMNLLYSADHIESL